MLKNREAKRPEYPFRSLFPFPILMSPSQKPPRPYPSPIPPSLLLSLPLAPLPFPPSSNTLTPILMARIRRRLQYLDRPLRTLNHISRARQLPQRLRQRLAGEAAAGVRGRVEDLTRPGWADGGEVGAGGVGVEIWVWRGGAEICEREGS